MAKRSEKQKEFERLGGVRAPKEERWRALRHKEFCTIKEYAAISQQEPERAWTELSNEFRGKGLKLPERDRIPTFYIGLSIANLDSVPDPLFEFIRLTELMGAMNRRIKHLEKQVKELKYGNSELHRA